MRQAKLSAICLAAITSALLLSSTNCLADNPTKPSHYKDRYKDEVPCHQPLILNSGLYLGADVLYDSYRASTTTAEAFGGFVSSATRHTVGAGGWGGGLFGGYGAYFRNMFYLAGEIFFNGSTTNQSNSLTLGTEGNDHTSPGGTVAVDMSWGISALPGLKLNDSTLGYIRLGYEQARIRGKQVLVTSIGGGMVIANKSNWRNGFDYGLGIETAVYPNVSIRTELNHTAYSTFNNGAGSYKPSDNQFAFGVLYHFA